MSVSQSIIRSALQPVLTVCTVAVYGFGLNIWDVTPENITRTLKEYRPSSVYIWTSINKLQIFYVDEFFYLMILGLTKISILMFYLRIFPSEHFKQACYLVIGWVTLWTVLVEFLAFFQCLPISYRWEGWMGNYSHDYKCFNMTALTYASAAINIAQDFVVLLLPVPWLLMLNVSLRKKINILILFSLGIL